MDVINNIFQIPEILKNVLDFLSLDELKIARLVCHEWYTISLKLLPTKCNINLRKSVLFSDNFKRWISVNSIFFNALNLIISDEMNMNSIEKPGHKHFWTFFSHNLKHIVFENLYMKNCDEFITILEHFSNLESFRYGQLAHVISYGDQLTNDMFQLRVNRMESLKFQNLRIFHFSIRGSRDVAEYFQYFTKSMRSLKEFKISISCSSPLRWYPIDWLGVLELIQNNATTLETLSIDRKAIEFSSPGTVLHDLNNIDNLNLKRFSFNNGKNDRIISMEESYYLEPFLVGQIMLEFLEIFYVKIPMDFSYFINNHSKLIALNLTGCTDVKFCYPANSAKKIQKISINRYNSNFERILHHLDKSSLKCLEFFQELNTPINAILHFNDLQELSINRDSDSSVPLIDQDVQLIIKGMKNLEVLRIERADKLTNASIYDNSSIENCISRLSKLKILEITSCCMTDVIFRDIIRLPNLRIFRFNTPAIRDENIKFLLKNCKKLEEAYFELGEDGISKIDDDLKLMCEQSNILKRLDMGNYSFKNITKNDLTSGLTIEESRPFKNRNCNIY